MKRPAQFLHETRARLILHAFGSLLLFMVAMIVTISGGSRLPARDQKLTPDDSVVCARMQERG